MKKYFLTFLSILFLFSINAQTCSSEPYTPPIMKRAEEIDTLWKNYYASKDSKFIKELISKFIPDSAKAEDNVVNSAIEFSLISNMLQYAEVERLLLKYYAVTTDDKKALLSAVVNEFNKRKENFRYEVYDGEFSAKITPVDSNLLEEIKKPSNIAPHVKTKFTAKRGEDVLFHILLCGMQLDDSYRANVTFDIKVLKPDGTIYFAEDNLDGLKRQLPLRFSNFTTEYISGVNFDPSDPSGIYIIKAKVIDHVAQKQVFIETKTVLE